MWARLAGAACLVVLAAAGSSGLSAAAEPATIPMGDRQTPPGWISIEKVSNGCGGGVLVGLQNWVGDTATYSSNNPFEPAFKVNFREACNFHDAAYSGAYVWDSIHGTFTDFRGMSRADADEKMHNDMNRACDAEIPAKYEHLREQCRAGVKHWLFVRLAGSLTYRDRTDLGGSWVNSVPGWPLCDVVARGWTVKQTDRDVTVTWPQGTSGSAVGTFKGVLITGDKLTDDRVVGEYTITDGGKKTGGGAMTLAVTGEDSLDFNGGSVGGKVVRKERSTQSAAARHFCRRPPTTTTTTTTKPAAHGTFVLVSNKVVNNNPKELTVDAAGGKAHLDHCCDGGHWQLDCTWKVPAALVAGKPASLTMSIHVYDLKPVQPILVAMGGRMPDFAEQLSAHAPEAPSNSKTYTPLFHDSQRDAKQAFVIINCDNAEITYLYKNSG